MSKKPKEENLPFYALSIIGVVSLMALLTYGFVNTVDWVIQTKAEIDQLPYINNDINVDKGLYNIVANSENSLLEQNTLIIKALCQRPEPPRQCEELAKFNDKKPNFLLELSQ